VPAQSTKRESCRLPASSQVKCHIAHSFNHFAHGLIVLTTSIHPFFNTFLSLPTFTNISLSITGPGYVHLGLNLPTNSAGSNLICRAPEQEFSSPLTTQVHQADALTNFYNPQQPSLHTMQPTITVQQV
jgi:hypothetical protein